VPSRLGEYRIRSARVGKTYLSISARRLINGSFITSFSLEDEHVEDEEVQRSACGAVVLKSVEGWSLLGVERDYSPSRIVSSGIPARALTTPGQRVLKSLSFREPRRTAPPLLSATAR